VTFYRAEIAESHHYDRVARNPRIIPFHKNRCSTMLRLFIWHQNRGDEVEQNTAL
jgi:hypothetical protein